MTIDKDELICLLRTNLASADLLSKKRDDLIKILKARLDQEKQISLDTSSILRDISEYLAKLSEFIGTIVISLEQGEHINLDDVRTVLVSNHRMRADIESMSNNVRWGDPD